MGQRPDGRILWLLQEAAVDGAAAPGRSYHKSVETKNSGEGLGVYAPTLPHLALIVAAACFLSLDGLVMGLQLRHDGVALPFPSLP